MYTYKLAGHDCHRIRTDKGVDNTIGISIEKDASLSPDLPPVDTPGGRLRHARLSNNLMLVDLAAKTGLSVVAIRMAEQNKTKVTPPNLRILANALEVSIAYLGCFESLPEETQGQRIKKARLYHGYTKVGFGALFGLSGRAIQGDRKSVV